MSYRLPSDFLSTCNPRDPPGSPEPTIAASTALSWKIHPVGATEFFCFPVFFPPEENRSCTASYFRLQLASLGAARTKVFPSTALASNPAGAPGAK